MSWSVTKRQVGSGGLCPLWPQKRIMSLTGGLLIQSALFLPKGACVEEYLSTDGVNSWLAFPWTCTVRICLRKSTSLLGFQFLHQKRLYSVSISLIWPYWAGSLGTDQYWENSEVHSPSVTLLLPPIAEHLGAALHHFLLWLSLLCFVGLFFQVKVSLCWNSLCRPRWPRTQGLHLL